MRSNVEIQNDMTPGKFWDQLNSHDWFHAMSDSHQVHLKGKANYERLQHQAVFLGEVYTELLSKFSSHIFSGKPWGTEKQPKPERPSE